MVSSAVLVIYFYPRPPRGGRPGRGFHRGLGKGFLSTPSARRATRRNPDGLASHNISIHALREEGDQPEQQNKQATHQISIHALREEGDVDMRTSPFRLILFLSTPSARRATLFGRILFLRAKQFLSTPSARRATSGTPSTICTQHYFYPRPPRGGRPGDVLRQMELFEISIHALREEGDSSRLVSILP